MKREPVTQLPLPVASEVFTVLCFFNCAHVVQSADHREAHDLMERHYTEKHAREIERIVGRYKR